MNGLITDYLNLQYKIVDNSIYLNNEKICVREISDNLKRIFNAKHTSEIIHKWSKDNGLNNIGWDLANKKILTTRMLLNNPINIIDFTFDELLDPTINYVLHKPVVYVFNYREDSNTTKYTLEMTDNILSDGKLYHNMQDTVSEMVRCCACSVLFGADRHSIISNRYWSLVEVDKYDEFHTKDYNDCYDSVNQSIRNIKDKINNKTHNI